MKRSSEAVREMNERMGPENRGGGQRKGRALTLLLCCAVMAATMGMASGAGGQGEPEGKPRATVLKEIQVVAHRGGAALAPENTLAALEQSITAGADMAEIDVQMTRDGVVVAIHDGSLDRTAGLNRRVWEADYATIRKLDAGGWYAREYAGAPIPTLKEIVWAAKGRIKLMIEIKCDSGLGERLVEETVKIVRGAEMEGTCILACADLPRLRQSKELAPWLDTVYIGQKMPADLGDLSYVDGYSIQLAGLIEEGATRAAQAGKKLYAWTVNTQQEMAAALELGVDGLVTDDPALAIELTRRAGDEGEGG